MVQVGTQVLERKPMHISKVPNSNSRISRRALLFGAGSGLASSILFSSEKAGAMPTQLMATSNVDSGALQIAIDYFRARANVIGGGKFGDFSKFFNPDVKETIDFELERYGKLSSLGSSNSWNGIIEHVSSEPQIMSATQIGSNIRLLVRDWTAINWRPAPPLIPIERSPAEWEFVRRDPVRYGLNDTSWTQTDSGFGTTHFLTLGKSNGTWSIFSDAYDEGIVGGTSPDYSFDLDSWAVGQVPKSIDSQSLKSRIQRSRPELPKSKYFSTHTFDYNAAAAYAIYWAYKYNSAYQNWGSTNTDCANFVSQSFIAGGYPTDGSWSPYSFAWVNNTGLRDWLINSGRGHDESASMLGLADCVNYDWSNNGSLDHIALVTSIPGSVPLVSCHTTSQRNVPYSSIYYAGYMPNQSKKYTGTWLYYPA